MMLTKPLAIAVAIAMSGPVATAAAATITANCTGMLNLDVYTFDPGLQTQEVAPLGTAEFSMTEDEIRLVGAFGVYRFDLKRGTLYHNDRDTGVYCTYTGLPGKG